jgi:hypothetical protein
MGVGFYLNCPDRSWCVAHVGQHKTKRRHRSGRNQSSQRVTRNAGTERKKKKKLLKKEIAGMDSGKNRSAL